MAATAGFRLVTFNLLHDVTSWPSRGPLAARQLAALAPDIVALQEVGVPDGRKIRQANCPRELLGSYCRNRILVLAMTSALYLGK